MTLVCTPVHTPLRLQPLDTTIYGTLIAAFNKTVTRTWGDAYTKKLHIMNWLNFWTKPTWKLLRWKKEFLVPQLHVFPPNLQKFIKSDLELDEPLNRVVFEMAKEKSAGGRSTNIFCGSIRQSTIHDGIWNETRSVKNCNGARSAL